MANKLKEISNTYISKNKDLSNYEFIKGFITLLKNNNVKLSFSFFQKNNEEMLVLLTEKGNIIQIEETNNTNFFNRKDFDKENIRHIDSAKIKDKFLEFNKLLSDNGIKEEFLYKTDHLIIDIAISKDIEDKKLISLPFYFFAKFNTEELYQKILTKFSEHLWDNIVIKKNIYSLIDSYENKSQKLNKTPKEIFVSEFIDTLINDFWDAKIESFINQLIEEDLIDYSFTDKKDNNSKKNPQISI